MVIFPTFFSGNIGHENVFYDILERKNAFLGNKNKKLKNSKNSHFSKRVNPWFWSTLAIFPTFCFRQYRRGKLVFYDILEPKNAYLGNKNKKLKKSKNCHFSNEINRLFCSKIGHFSNFFF